MSNPVEITERFLSDAGGWQALKQARGLVEAGRVMSADYTPPLLKGVVREGGKDFRAGLNITDATRVENLCSCRAAREWGTVCAHSLAVGLAAMRSKNETSVGEKKPLAPASAVPGKGPFFSTTKGSESIMLHVILSPNFQAAWEKNAVMVGAEAEQAGQRVLLHTLDAKKTFRCTPEDARAIEKLRALNNGELAGMLILQREPCLDLLRGLAGHPRVSFGKNAPVNVAELLRSLQPFAAPDAVTIAEKSSLETSAELKRPQFRLTLEGSLNHLSARLQAVYGNRVVEITGKPALQSAGGSHASLNDRSNRHIPAEQEALDHLTRWGFTGPDTTGHFVLKREATILTFFAQEFPRLQREWEVSVGARFSNVAQNIERITPRIDIQSSGENWFDVTVSLATPDGNTFSSAEIQRLLQMGQNHARMKNGRLAVFDSALLDELQSVLQDCAPQQTRPGTYRIDRTHAGYIDAVLGEGALATAPPVWRTWASAQRHAERVEPVPLGVFEDVLRPYQKQGVYWMSFLARNGFGGIMADEMGLGKTLQALAFLQTCDSSAGKPSLVVCPSSLVQNWRREAMRFAPGLRLLIVEGSNRAALFSKMRDPDVIITSYPLLRRDLNHYRSIQFSSVILDEAQHIKNPDTQNAQSATGLKSDHRFVLTGTPIENSVRDLWSLMQFLMPGYLGTRADFRERYEQPMLSGDASVSARLSKRMRPFLLRRLKKNVVTDLPDKIEQVAFCELTGEQRLVYDQLLTESRRRIDEISREKNSNKARMVMLTALLRLRQASCDLRLLKLPQIASDQTSGKVEMLDELLREAVDGGHRVLIFSQFVSMLQLIKQQVESQRMPNCYLDGETKNRLEEVDRFQNNPQIPVFLISLKAGGVGLNLTGADTVIHFDPWWNPSVEAQATDRTHRIGQKKVVTSYKLIARGTVEEKILRLQQTKQKAAAATLENDERQMPGLTAEEIASLLAE
jgi:superfamily II DNA or RNA helicase